MPSLPAKSVQYGTGIHQELLVESDPWHVCIIPHTDPVFQPPHRLLYRTQLAFFREETTPMTNTSRLIRF